MTDLAVQVRLSAEDGGLVGQLRLSTQEVDELSGAQKRAAGAADELSTATGKSATAGRAAGSATSQLAEAETRAATSTRQLTAAQNDNVRSAGQQRAAQQNLGRQIGDITSGLASGIPVQQIFAQQGAQVADAISGMGGILGRVGTFLSGPWGAAVLGAVTVLGSLYAGLSSDASASDAAKEAAERLKRAKEDLANAAAAATRTAYSEANANLALARSYAETAVKAREAAAAKVAAARDELRASTIRQAQIGPRGELATLATDVNARRVGALEAELAKANSEVEATRRQARVLEVPVARLQAAEATDKATAATRRYERAESDLIRRRAANKISQDQLTSGLIELTRTRDAELDAVRKSERAGRSKGDADREAGKAAREFARDQRELNSTLEELEARFDPATSAANRYKETLRDITRLETAKRLSPDRAAAFRQEALLDFSEQDQRAQDDKLKKRLGKSGEYIVDGMEKPLIEVGDVVKGKLVEAGRAGGDSFRDAGIGAIEQMSDLIGGKFGRIVRSVFALADSPLFSAPGLSRQDAGRGPADSVLRPVGLGSSGAGFSAGLREVTDKFDGAINKTFDRVFGEKGIFPEGLTKTLGKAFGYAGVGGGVGGAFGSKAGGALGGAAGGLLGEKVFGKLLGDFAGPLGSIAGGILGGVVGNLIKSTPRASATITSADEKASVAGNNAGLRQAASGLATSVQGGLQQIAEALGGTLGSFAVSIGVRDKNLRVDTTGSGITKTKKGAVDFGQDEGGAIAFAIADAIADEAVQGLSPKVAAALRSNDNIDKAIKEALNVQELETLLGGIDGAIGKTFKDLERQLAERNRIAQKYGFDLVKLEQQNAEDRKKAFEQVLAERTGPLQALLKDLSFGNLFEGTIADQRDKVLAEIAKAEVDATAGKDGAAQQVADLRRQLLDISRNAFGTAGPEYAADLNSSRAAAERIIATENERVKAQADAAQATNDKLDTNNKLTNETNDLLAEATTYLSRMANTPAPGAVVGGGSARGFGTERVAAL